MCQGVLGTSSCAIGSTVRFFWKNVLGMGTAHDDLARDACSGFMSTRDCFATIFNGAGKRDVLIVGSILSNSSYSATNGFNSWLPLAMSAPQFVDTAEHANTNDMFDLLLAAFPGQILWHSYPVLRMELDTEKSPFLNHCLGQINQLVSCSIDRFVAADTSRRSRLTFVNLQPLQRAMIQTYVDLIHHPGELSMRIVKAMLRTLLTKFDYNCETQGKKFLRDLILDC